MAVTPTGNGSIISEGTNASFLATPTGTTVGLGSVPSPPMGISAGDRLFLYIHTSTGWSNAFLGPGINPPSGWTVATAIDTSGGTGATATSAVGATIYTRIATGTSLDTPNLQFARGTSPTGSFYFYAYMFGYRGLTSSTIAATGGTTSGNPTAAVTQGVVVAPGHSSRIISFVAPARQDVVPTLGVANGFTVQQTVDLAPPTLWVSAYADQSYSTSGTYTLAQWIATPSSGSRTVHRWVVITEVPTPDPGGGLILGNALGTGGGLYLS